MLPAPGGQGANSQPTKHGVFDYDVIATAEDIVGWRVSMVRGGASAKWAIAPMPLGGLDDKAMRWAHSSRVKTHLHDLR